MFCADLARWLDGRTSFSYFRVFHAMKMGVNFHRFGGLMPCFLEVEHLLDNYTILQNVYVSNGTKWGCK